MVILQPRPPAARRCARASGNYLEVTDLAGGSSVQRGTLSLVKVVARGRATTGPLAIFTTVSWSQQVSLDLLVTMVPFIHDKSVRIVGMYFCDEATNFVSGSELNGAFFLK